MGFYKNLLAFTILLSTTACTGAGKLGLSGELKEVSELNNTVAVGGAFSKNLTDHYREFSNYQQNERYDMSDARHFARKGLQSATGEIVMPEPVHSWNIKREQMATFSDARSRLIRVLDAGARSNHPVAAANAQSNYDCWIEQSEEYWRTDELRPCKQGFLAAMADLEKHLTPGALPSDVISRNERPDLPEPPFEPIQTNGQATKDYTEDPGTKSEPESAKSPLQAENAKFLAFFDWDSAQVSSSAEKVLMSVSQEVQNNDALNSITLTGHADTSGPESYNMRLGQRRADAVKKALKDNGLDTVKITTLSRGENDLMVETDDGVREPSNRRVEITFD